MRWASALIAMALPVLTGCGQDQSGSKGSSLFGNQAKATAAKPIVPVKPLVINKSVRGSSPVQPLRLKPNRGPSLIQPLKVQPVRTPTPLQPARVQPTGAQAGQHKNLFDGTAKARQPQPAQSTAQQPKTFWEWLAGDPKINQQK